ncbi:MAG: chaperone modulator CbpM [Sediminicola sp.]|tara:strand:+ start:3015 stop:3308 length:294 start_codon:yes stop_codon:yes gene_type:complete
MESELYITISEFCNSHQIEESFVMSLREYELVHLSIIGDQPHIHQEDLPKLEKMVRLNQELGINLEGLEAIHFMLERMEGMQREVRLLRNRLKRFEP